MRHQAQKADAATMSGKIESPLIGVTSARMAFRIVFNIRLRLEAWRQVFERGECRMGARSAIASRFFMLDARCRH